MTDAGRHDVTTLLARVSEGDQAALADLLPMVYQELHDIAERALRRERRDHTLQPTALINEAYLRLVDQRDVQWQNRSHFVGVAATVMRRVLVDHARRHRSEKRGGAMGRVGLTGDSLEDREETDPLDLVALDDALKRLSEMDPRQGRIVELRYFGGLGVEESAAVLGVSPATVKREWNSARAWLRRELRSD
jgi:RNA polymerase sigma factor (TIGR02999 family)